MTETTPTRLIDRYFTLAPQPDRDAYFAQFAEHATVEDEGVEHHGLDAIRTWRVSVPLVSYTVVGIESGDDGPAASVDIAGDFPGSPVRLCFHFRFDAAGRIIKLTIRP
jgi:hypothetical protein